MTVQRRFSIGKYRALQRASTAEGLFNIVAIDHQDALRRSLNVESPQSVSDDEMVLFKRQVVSALADDLSGVLLDPLYGAFQAIVNRSVGQKGLLVELEKADYQMEPLPLDVEIDPDWNVAKIKQMNADGVKLFFYYNPHSAEHAQRQEAIVSKVVAECASLEIPFYAEPIVYRDDSTTSGNLVADAARQIDALGVDVLKLEFPVDTKQEQNTTVWLQACEEVTQSIEVPWVLLSAGVTFEMFTRQLEIACKAGASGFIVGRALWGAAAKLNDVDERLRWLHDEGRKRLRLLNAITAQYGASWHQNVAFTRLLPDVMTDTFRRYPVLRATSND